MFRTSFFAFLMGLSAVVAEAIDTTAAEIQPLSIGMVHTLQSANLEEKRELLVALPEGYMESDQKYPVVFLTEGQWYFSYVAEMVKRLTAQEHMPASIVVATKMANPKRFGLLRPGDNGASKFLSFLSKEVIPYIDGRYRTNGKRALLGWEYGGAFALHVLQEQPELFEGYIVASPFPVNEHNSDFSRISSNDPKFLFYGVSDNETVVNDGVSSLTEALQKAGVDNLKWDNHQAAGGDLIANHITSPYPLFVAGLSHYHSDYRPLRPENAAEFRAKGGLDYANTYYASRAERYGTPAGVDKESFWWLLRVAMESDDLPLFEELLPAANIFSEAWLSNTGDYWYVRYGNFLVEKGKYEDAVALLQTVKTHFPQSVRVAYRLAKAMEAIGNRGGALAAYKKAIQLAEEQSHERAASLKEELAAFQQADGQQ